MSTQPITPKQLKKARNSLPAGVIAIWNGCIKTAWNGSSATVLQDDAVKALVEGMNVTRQEVFDSGWLDCEASFRKAGWKVRYDKPGYNENYRAYYEFRP